MGYIRSRRWPLWNAGASEARPCFGSLGAGFRPRQSAVAAALCRRTPKGPRVAYPPDSSVVRAVFVFGAHYFYERRWIPIINCWRATLTTAQNGPSGSWSNATLTLCIRPLFANQGVMLRRRRTSPRRSLLNSPGTPPGSSGTRPSQAGFTPVCAARAQTSGAPRKDGSAVNRKPLP